MAWSAGELGRGLGRGALPCWGWWQGRLRREEVVGQVLHHVQCGFLEWKETGRSGATVGPRAEKSLTPKMTPVLGGRGCLEE